MRDTLKTLLALAFLALLLVASLLWPQKVIAVTLVLILITLWTRNT